MSDAPRQPPAKKDVALALLEESSMFIHLDPRRADVLVPKWFLGQPQLVLQVGLNMAIPIPDLKIDDGGITCTLSFNRAPFWCRIPWSAVYALVGEDGRGGVWADDVPPEIQLQKQSAPPNKGQPAKKARPKLSAVGASERPRVRDQQAEKQEAKPRGPSSLPEPRTEGDEAERRPSLSAVPRPASSPEAEEAAPAEETSTDQPSQPAGGRKPKREIPPYLRVIK